MATTDVRYTLGFEDDTQQDVTIGPFDPSKITGAVKTKTITFNNNFTSDTANLLLSKYGNKWRGIDRLRVITTEVTTYF